MTIIQITGASTMAFYSFKLLAGAAVTFVTTLAIANPSMARPIAQQANPLLLSQVNQPETEGTPQLTTDTVEGRITRIDGDEVELRLSSGETRTYTISEADQERNELTVGSNVVLNVRGDTVIAINPDMETMSESSGTMQSGESSSSSSSSTTVIRRQTTVQQTSPAPAPAPAPAAQPAPQPVRGLW
jgi:hypothetical protein